MAGHVCVEGPEGQSEGRGGLSFRYASTAMRVWSGDVLSRLDRERARAGIRHALLLCGKSVASGPQLSVVLDAMDGAAVTVFPGARTDSPVDVVAAAIEAAVSAGCDGVIALGGGSAIVTARAMSMAAEVGAGRDLGFEPMDVPCIVVPTTPTTAMARLGAAVRAADGHRLELFHPAAHPRSILLDHDLMSHTPAAVYLDAGVATFCNAAELFTTPDLPRPAQADFREAVDLAGWALARWATGGADRADVRAALGIAAFLCGRAADAGIRRQASIGMAVGHGLQGLGPHVTHGKAMAAGLAGALRFNRAAASEGQQRLLEVLRTHSAEARDPAAAVTSALQGIGMPASPADLDLTDGDLVAMAPQLLGSHFVKSNLRSVRSTDEMEAALVRVW